MTTTLAERPVPRARAGVQTRETVANILSQLWRDRGALRAVPSTCVLAPRLVVLLVGRLPGARPTLDCPGDVAAIVEPGHLDLIVGNLLSNAARYGGGATRLEVRAHGDVVHLSVIDAGPGIPEAARAGLFSDYRRGATGQGQGLGLRVSHDLARANGGDLVYAERPEGGAEFRLTLPRVALS